MTNRSIPVGYQDFYQRSLLEDVLIRLKSTNVIILTGVSGCGKTELARQVLKKFYREDENLVEGRLRSDSQACLLSELRNYSNLKGFQMNALNADSLADILEEFYKCINERFPERLKYFLFDDVELQTQLVSHIDSKILGSLHRLPEDDTLRKSWKIIITTRFSSNHWLNACDHVTSENFIKMEGFSDDEITDFLFRSERARSLTDDDLDLIREKFGRLPLMLKSLRKEIESDLSVSATEILRSLVKRIDQIGPENRMYAALHVSLHRLVTQSISSEHYKQLIMMLTMFNDSNITTDLLISCAEVVLAGDNKVQELPPAAYKLQRSFVADMVQQSLCDRPVEFSDTSLINLHKLVKQSMKLFREPIDAQRDVTIARKALIALTRVMPRDGRAHQSHVIHGYLYDHACCLLDEVHRLEAWGAVNRVRTPCVLLLMSTLQTAMAYSQFALRTPGLIAATHIVNALNSYSQLFADRNYDELGAWLPDSSVDVQKADTLYEESIGVQSIVYTNQAYGQLINDSTQFHRITSKDIEFLTDYSYENPENRLENGHLSFSNMREMQYLRRVLEPVKIKEFYAAEQLAEIFSMAAKIIGYNREALAGDSKGYAEAALHIYSRIKADFAVSLMGDVVTAREVLNIRLMADSITPTELDEMAVSWKALLQAKGRAFEYGLLRSDFTKDGYHKFLCEEGLVRTLGRRCAVVYTDNTFDEVNAKFLNLIEKTTAEDPKLPVNFMTTSKAYKHYAEFLWRCGKLRDAVRAVIDSFMHLNYFLLTKNRRSNFPEQEETCGKVKPLLDVLWKYYREYDRSPSGGGLLQHDGSDQQRIDYVSRFVKFWLKNNRAGSERLSIMERILNLSDIDIADPYVHQAVPVQASG